ncbi:hypothetical protein IX307_001788 [Bacteroides pyogenes]|uniref:hypothetical protein n=1 Tax=Bacteroides pyogenes TaxID=310300 RepID=UPI001BA7286F|nr:hypothetical protein [Bacteroides pyogenes]MBR8720617.1 hypothetical protein [Bacteroides pyogenes]MBR8725564.1 hypothetical protein [Bacteroides pyogenes]MBR8738817.1 hypothetical protein [Bacteroides pyogenes]MBR8754604.1 hypothetical protein [Bacteroides pyogenes]MBR8787459.1 hypothetical protein [Bacteroides pyogenes]
MTGKRLYIFNPEHDLALASGESHYMAPASARQMASDLALLPVWYAGDGNAVLAPSAYAADFLKEMQERLGMRVELVTPPEVADAAGYSFSPWGWDPALRRRLLSLGAAESSLPSAGGLEALRTYSHRSHAAALLRTLQADEHFCGEAFYLKTPDEWRSFVEGRENSLLKAPLSGSGKGLNWCKGAYTSFISGWCERIGASQGGVIAEPVYRKTADFAMEFHSDGRGAVAFAGYSLFRTGGSGMYEGNCLLSNERIREKLSAYVPVGAIERLKVRLEEELSRLIGSVCEGYLGVDMMICHFPGEKPCYRIHPCVEINLRMNMGVVARCVKDRYMAADAEGEMRIGYHHAEGEALAEHRRMAAAFPLEIEDGKIRSGYLSLVPVSKHSKYRAWVVCGEHASESL